jgi:hypothetical protein
MDTLPIPYIPYFEHPDPDEPTTSQALNDTLHAILETTAADDGHAVRAVHAKSHGLIDATLTSSPASRPNTPRASSPAPASTPPSCASPPSPATSSTMPSACPRASP